MKIRAIYLLFIGLLMGNIQLQAQYAIEANLRSNAEVLLRGCSDAIIFSLDKEAVEDLTFNVEISGTASRGDDYNTSLGSEIIFLKGDNEQLYSIVPLLGGNPSISETIIITITGEELDSDYVYTLNLLRDAEITIDYPRDTILACREIPIQVSVNGPAGQYKWSPTDLVSDSIGSETSLLPEKDGWFYVEGTIGSCKVYDSVYVDLIDPVVNLFTTDPTHYCEEGEVTLNANTNYPDYFSWNNEEYLSDPSSLTPIAHITESTAFIGTLTFYNCTISDTLFIQIDSLPHTSLISAPGKSGECTKYCKGDVIKVLDNELIIDEQYPNIKYQWNSDPTIINQLDTLRSILVEVDVDRVYVRKTTNGMCEKIDTILIEVIDTDIELFPSDTTVCFEKPVKVRVDPGSDLTEIEWTPTEGLSCTDCLEPTITPTRTQSYTIKATKENCCPVEATITINVDIPPIPIDQVFTCPEDPVRIIVDGDSLRLQNPKWIDNTNSLSCTNCFNPEAHPSQSTTYTLEAYDEEGCLNRGTARVSLYQDMNMAIGVEPSLVMSVGADVVVTLDPKGEEIDPESIDWYYNGSFIGSGSMDITAKIKKEGTENIVTAMFINIYGCKQDIAIVITGEKPNVQIPNAFSPDEDGSNDFFRPLFEQSPVPSDLIQEFIITNRFGQVVYNNENAQGWDGRMNGGRKAPPDVYLYRVTLNLPNNNVFKTKGSVTLIR